MRIITTVARLRDSGNHDWRHCIAGVYRFWIGIFRYWPCLPQKVPPSSASRPALTMDLKIPDGCMSRAAGTSTTAVERGGSDPCLVRPGSSPRGPSDPSHQAMWSAHIRQPKQQRGVRTSWSPSGGFSQSRDLRALTGRCWQLMKRQQSVSGQALSALSNADWFARHGEPVLEVCPVAQMRTETPIAS